ncbi:TetR/AcrR family transcriptional regulator [Actinocrinis puniceicyclus]|uniref:TetR/AcrR family transcriptional regulator n=1 Tax=Actinocrinis puniceicyclus TaxID=977794 RepID=A0A8J7WLF6_9ACTN|nr:TetR/AcrR family transcriptional regulator [Actinocrinis puniceicyclus]MBS2962262.1 TetR/AcrR family transcriptional regulator [Actinocrinis puniceicyclus]
MSNETVAADPPAPSTGRARNPRTHQAILDATVQLLGEVGYQDLSIERVASRAGVGKATIYRWWNSKSALVIEAMERGLPVELPEHTGDPRTDLRAAIQSAVQTYAVGQVGSTVPALAAEVSRDATGAEQLRQFLRPRRDAAREVLHQAAAVGTLPPDVDIETVIDLFIGAIFYRSLVRKLPVDAVMVEQLVELILDGRLPRTIP